MQHAAGIGYTAAKGRIVSCQIRERDIVVCADVERAGCRAKGHGTVSINAAPVGQLLCIDTKPQC